MVQAVGADRPSWRPTNAQIQGSRVVHFARWLVETHQISLRDVTDYRELHNWTVHHVGDFWQAVADYFDVDFGIRATEALRGHSMPGAVWFPGATLNFGDHLLRSGPDDGTAVLLVQEDGRRESISFAELRRAAKAMAAHLEGLGVQVGDRVVGYLPNCIEGVVAFAACALLGAVWAQAGLDYGAQAAAERLEQLQPKAIIVGGGYWYKGAVHDRRRDVERLIDLLPTIGLVISVETAGCRIQGNSPLVHLWEDLVAGDEEFRPRVLPFDHPLWVLFSSGTTGRPKGIVHGHGGALLEQLASPGFHLDLGPSDVFFWYTSPNWMMWNAQICGLLHGATIVLYDGGATSPNPDTLWRLAAELGVTVMGTSPGYIDACIRAGAEPGMKFDLSKIRVLGVTGSVLPRGANAWVRKHVSHEVQVGSASGGTDVVGIFVTSAPSLPVWDGEISTAALGVALEVWDDNGNPVPPGTPGEMVITEPMPSMPVCLWNDPNGTMLRDTYFSKYPGVWRQGDWITATEYGTVVIHGRSDATLNRRGVRIGSAEIYAAVASMPEVSDVLVVGVEDADGGYWMPMFVVASKVLGPGTDLRERIRARIATRVSPRHVPDEIVVVPSLPHTRTGKRLEVPVKRLLQGVDAAEVCSPGAVDDIEALNRLAQYSRATRSRRLE